MSFDLQGAIEASVAPGGTGVVQLPYGETVLTEVITVDQDVTIQGASMTGSQLVCPGIHVTTRGAVNLKNFRLTGPGNGTGITFDYAFHSSVERVLIEGFDVCVAINAGNCWDITRAYLLPNQWGVQVQNVENADEGDWSIFGTTIADPTGKALAAVHVLSSGGGRIVDNKFLGFMYPVLLETSGYTSDFIAAANSIENFSQVGIAGRVVSGSYTNVLVIGNQFSAPNAHAVTMNGMNRGAACGNVAACLSPFLQNANAPDWQQSTNTE